MATKGAKAGVATGVAKAVVVGVSTAVSTAVAMAGVGQEVVGTALGECERLLSASRWTQSSRPAELKRWLPRCRSTRLAAQAAKQTQRRSPTADSLDGCSPRHARSRQ